MGIDENNNVGNPKDLRGMARNAKSMKRNNEACKGILIALPRHWLESYTVTAEPQIQLPFIDFC